MRVTKFSGEIVSFDSDKLKRSLLKSGANEMMVSQIMEMIKTSLYDGIPTKKIYKLAFQHLKKLSNVHAARYNLRTAITKLGPAGFYFEKFVSKLFENEGYNTILNKNIEGHCVSHEIDILVNKKDVTCMIECKFHAKQDAKTDVKIPMYILSRYNDVKNIGYSLFEENQMINDCWIVTNNRFTEDAIRFSKCMQLNLLCWDYPENNNLKDKIDTFQLYPITALTTLTQSEKDKLLSQEVILVKELLKDIKWLEKLGLSSNRVKNVIKEANQLCNCN